MKKSLIAIVLMLCSALGFSQNKIAPWISYPSASVNDYGVFHFRKSIDFKEVPSELVVHISADNRYNFFVNGQRVCYGPAKGDLQTYKYDIIDIAPYLKDGKNQLAALVYNGGKDKALALQSVQTAFMLRAENENYSEINSDTSWKVYKNPAYKPVSYDEMLFKERWFYGFYACGPGDNVNAARYPWGWEKTGFDDGAWENAQVLSFDGKAPWNLVPRNIAFMDDHLEYPAKVRKATGVKLPLGKWNGQSKITVPANTSATILVDFELFTMGYPELKVSGGKNGSIQIKYAEALYEKVNLKGHRDSVNNLTMYGVWDMFYPDGNERIFRPLWKRAFRYVQFVIETKEQALEIRSFINEYSGYPYPDMATFESDDPGLNEIFEMSLQTLRMCSGETYYDTPFYEQLSYGGDNRPISAISGYNTTDDRLFREVMRLYPQSENSETGLFKSAYPSRFNFDMGSWSMAWIQSLHDYYFLRGDADYVKQFVDNIERVLGFYERHMDEKTGLIGSVQNKNFIDWSIVKGSLPRADENKEMKQSALLTLYFAHTMDCAVRLYNEIGETAKVKKWKTISSGIKMAVFANCWNEEKQLFTDYPNQELYSQHTNLMAILCDVLAPSQQKTLLNRVLTYNGFKEVASSYFSFFLFKAMQKTGQEELFLENLDFWHAYIDRGHTTCGETGFASHDRSDCHAWSAHPAYFLLSTTCGIKPADIGFNTVKIAPHLGDLKSIKASMPHPKGRIKVSYQLKKGKCKALVILPKSMSGTFQAGTFLKDLKEGENTFEF
ncbi:alpha-L-rhamnosidase C-terminal domain-containing protein [uncultured Draconibacterium sp.]|uniref:alpha-L-rhamnosidase-related protein n=1 Tax=uncultured Draconibacterium sp. TaxID=1573823 RepID=UPI0029C61052|nr:alpha-L-rhamnosidase C-terminal domain-containing protein [uncultured Draconibacterium sp.]